MDLQFQPERARVIGNLARKKGQKSLKNRQNRTQKNAKNGVFRVFLQLLTENFFD